MSPRHLPQPSAEAARRRLAGLLDTTSDTAWEDVPDHAVDDPPFPDSDTAAQTESSPRRSSRTAAAAWRRETVLVVCAMVLVGIVIAGLVLLRSRPLEIIGEGTGAPVAAGADPRVQLSPGPTPATSSSATSSSASPSQRTTPSPAPASLAAHVIGEVQRPGLVVLSAGARVDDAIAAAGGMTSRANPGDLNLAQPLQDGQQVLVGSSSEPGGEVRGPGAAPATSSSLASGNTAGAAAAKGANPAADPGAAGGASTININTASALELEELPGVGPATAQKIITWREQNGGFATLEQLMDVPGIGAKTYAEIAPRAQV